MRHRVLTTILLVETQRKQPVSVAVGTAQLEISVLASVLSVEGIGAFASTGSDMTSYEAADENIKGKMVEAVRDAGPKGMVASNIYAVEFNAMDEELKLVCGRLDEKIAEIAKHEKWFADLQKIVVRTA